MAGILYTTVLFFLQNKRNNMSRQNVLYEKWAEIEIMSHFSKQFTDWQDYVRKRGKLLIDTHILGLEIYLKHTKFDMKYGSYVIC